METKEISEDDGLTEEEDTNVGTVENGIVGIIVIFAAGAWGRAGFSWIIGWTGLGGGVSVLFCVRETVSFI